MRRGSVRVDSVAARAPQAERMARVHMGLQASIDELQASRKLTELSNKSQKPRYQSDSV